MPVIATPTNYGYVLTCTGGTAVAAVVVNKEKMLNVVGVHFAGAASTDIITINDAKGNFFCKGFGSAGVVNHNITFAKPVRIAGLQVAMAGATTGQAVVFCE